MEKLGRLNQMQVIHTETSEALFTAAADLFARLAIEAIRDRGRFDVALSGGSTPKKLYSLLAGEGYRNKIDWAKVHFFFGDERFVAPDHNESNFRMANDALFCRIPVPEANVHRFRTETGYPQTVAAEMNLSIAKHFELGKGEIPCFDLILLGLGTDGHIASLFPETSALEEDSAFAVSNFVPKFDAFRLTLTFPVINHARNVLFLISGEDKKDIFREVFGDKSVVRFPAQLVRLISGELIVLTDLVKQT